MPFCHNILIIKLSLSQIFLTEGNGKLLKTRVGMIFFSVNKNIFIQNLDWFKPFENSEHSIGVVYLSILNLPRHLIFKWKYTIVCGIYYTWAEGAKLEYQKLLRAYRY